MGDAEFFWGELIHLGMNFWTEKPRERCTWPNLESAEVGEAVRLQYAFADHVRFDEEMWRTEVAPALRASGVNLLLVDLGEGVVYPSHPELAVRGSWSADRLRDEVRRLRAMGFEVVPKLNFSSTHDLWLGDYHRMVSTPDYYRVCSDLIGDVMDIFEGPRLLHLGLDEETADSQSRNDYVSVRQGELWWHDVIWLVGETERRGARAWVWNDYARYHPIAEFAARMPKSVLQSPWSYRYHVGGTPKDNRNIGFYAQLADAGYDVVPCGSNCYGYKTNFRDTAAYCREHCPAERIRGFLFAPWLAMHRVFAERFRENAGQVAETIAFWNKSRNEASGHSGG